MAQIVTLAIQKRNVDALETLLGDKPYFGGDRPSIVDCSAFAIVFNLLDFPVPFMGVREYLEKKPGLVAYVTRMKQQFFQHE